MKDYYEHTRNIFRITERLSERFATGTATTTRRLFFPLLPRRQPRGEDFDGFFSRGGQLHVSDRQLFNPAAGATDEGLRARAGTQAGVKRRS